MQRESVSGVEPTGPDTRNLIVLALFLNYKLKDVTVLHCREWRRFYVKFGNFFLPG
jgi:hypothetical protein